MMEMYNLILKENLTPNQFYVLYSIRENISAINVNIHAELRALSLGNWITKTSEVWKLEPKSMSLIEQVESFFKVQKKKTDTQLMGTGFTEKAQSYLLQFPKKRLPSGKAARADIKNIETAFRWFFNNYDYSWETILEATSRYVHEYEKNSYMYMQTSQYFIRKQQSDKTWGSELANCCSTVVSGQDEEDDKHFVEPVV